MCYIHYKTQNVYKVKQLDDFQLNGTKTVLGWYCAISITNPSVVNADWLSIDINATTTAVDLLSNVCPICCQLDIFLKVLHK